MKIMPMSIVTAVAVVFGYYVVAHADPAVVIDPAGPCTLLDGDGNLVATNDTKIVATQSANGNAHLKCKADVAPSSSGRAANFDNASTGLLCGIANPFGFDVTDQWHQTVSASGKATLTCHAKD